MNTTYKMIYKALNDNGKIDEIINKYSKDENIQIVKVDIVFGIETAVDFFNENDFTKMDYAIMSEEALKRFFKDDKIMKMMIAQTVIKEYAKIELKRIEQDKKCFEYMLAQIE